jgi:hypothetical protein
MSNKRITDLTELTNPTTDDVFPVVDIATNTTTKVQLGNLPVPSSVTTALATKQDSLVSGTNIKTINSTSVLGSGNIAVQPTLVSGTSIKTVNSNSLLGSGDVAVQETLVSGTNIKTINSTSLLGSGNITIAANPSGVSGAIQFSNGSAFASDAANLFWDDTNNRLGVGTNAPNASVTINGNESWAQGFTSNLRLNGASPSLQLKSISGTGGFMMALSGSVTYFAASTDSTFGVIAYKGNLDGNNWSFGNGVSTNLGATVGIKGSGSTSATTSLLVQDSTGQEMFRVRDNNQIDFRAGQLSWINPAANCWRAVNGGSSPNVVGTSWLQSGNFIINDGTSLSSFNTSVMLGVVSTTKGFLPPVMTTTQKNAIASPAAGLVVYDSTTNKLCCYNGSTWNDLF